jgi:hypothetical protein
MRTVAFVGATLVRCPNTRYRGSEEPTLDKTNRYEEKTGGLRALSTQCKSYDARFMLDYKRYVDLHNPEITLARLEALIELQNESLANIRQRTDDLGVDLSTVSVSYRVD